jgi:dATP/dGTP diphosphohydrolase
MGSSKPVGCRRPDECAYTLGQCSEAGRCMSLDYPDLREESSTALPTDSAERKDIPLARGVLDYFPAALAEIAKLSKAGNDKHNPGQDLHWSRGKSGDHADCILRHLAERGTIDTDGLSHSVKVAWRALALLQEELEGKGAPMSRASRVAT